MILITLAILTFMIKACSLPPNVVSGDTAVTLIFNQYELRKGGMTYLVLYGGSQGGMAMANITKDSLECAKLRRDGSDKE